MVYVQASIKLHPGKLQDFISLISKLSPVTTRHGWKLLGSYASVVGRLNTVVDMWELTDIKNIEALFADPEMAKMGPLIAEIIEDEVLTVLTKLPIG